ncbi:MAG TPA: MarR family transcriptional regulator [Polyangiaceae bacterium]|jgi:DNA-binding MarR family transcriptional regulator
MLSRTAALLAASREYSTAAVVLHGLVAERFGLSATDVKALDVLQRRGPLTAGDIATATGLATASVTALVDRLEKKRLVRRTRAREDRRKVIVELTPTMHARVAPLFEPLERRMKKRMARYSVAELALIAAFMRGAAADMLAVISPSRETP